MTAKVKSGSPLFEVCRRVSRLRAWEEAEPVRRDGCSCGDPGVGSHLTWIRRVAAALAGRGC